MMRQLANFRDALGAAALAGLLMTAGACSDTTSDDVEGSSLEDEGDTDGADESSGGDADQGGFTSAGGGDTDGGEGEGESGETTDGGGSTGEEPGTEDPVPEIGAYALCPDELPEGWIFCEDFEGVGDPSNVFFDYVDAEGNFAPTDDGGASGVGSMKAHYREEIGRAHV